MAEPESQQEDEIVGAVNDAQKLLRYAAQIGIDLPKDIVDPLTKSTKEMKAGTLSTETAGPFYTAYAKLAAKTDQKALKQLRIYGVSAALVAFIIISFSIVTFFTNSMSSEILTLINRGNDQALKLHDEISTGPGAPDQIDTPVSVKGTNALPALAEASLETAPAATICGTDRAPLPPTTDKRKVVAELQDFAATMRYLLKDASKLNIFLFQLENSPLDDNKKQDPLWKDNSRVLLQLTPPLLDLTKEWNCKIYAYQDVRDFAQSVRNTSLAAYGALAAYVLPVFYALLGAMAYDLRDFSERVRRRSYHPSSSSVARMIAASTLGAIISLFNNFGESIALSPLALAFLVGYGVEAFFSFLDRLLSVFNNGPGADAGAKVATAAKPNAAGGAASAS